MTKEEIAKRFCKFELCTHRNGEGMCCLFNQDNCIFYRLEKENAELKETVIKMNNVITETFSNLTKAKDLLAKWVELYKPKSETALPTPIQVETEQFLKEIEKCQSQKQH